MSAIVLSAGGVGLLITFLLVVYLTQIRRRNADEKTRRIKRLSGQQKAVTALIRSIPSPYIDKKVLALLVQTKKEFVQQIKAIDPQGNYNVQLEECAVMGEAIKSGQAIAPVVDPANEQSGKELRQNLKKLFKFIENNSKKGRMDKKFASQQLHNTQLHIAQSLADAHGHRAKAAEKGNKFRVAIHHLHDGIEVLAKVAHQPQAKRKIELFQQSIAALEAKAQKHSNAKVGKVPENTANSLNNQLEELQKEEDEWRRKQDYEA